MNPSDEVLKIALAFVEQPEASDRVRAELNQVGISPLSAAIYETLENANSDELISALKGIAALNQGHISDLDAGDFRSYIIAKIGLTDIQLDECVRFVREHAETKTLAQSLKGVDCAPLASCISDFIAHSPLSEWVPAMKRIAALNRGTIDDLDVADFRSNLSLHIGTADRDLRRIGKVLRNFQAITADAEGANYARPLAARDEQKGGGGAVTPADLLDLIKDDKQ